jgi:altronate dehydratase small subunit
MGERYVEVVEPEDNVATLLRDAAEGERLEVPIDTERTVTVTLDEPIDFGHKVALSDIDVGDQVFKYGKQIGNASEAIAAGEWAHVHNIDSNYGRGDLKSDANAKVS